MPKSLKSTAVLAKRQTMVLVITAVLLLIGGGVGIYAIQTKQSAADAELASKEAEVGNSQKIAARYQFTLDAYNATMEQLKFVEPAMSQESYVPTLVEQLQRMAVADHLKLTSVRPGLVVDPAPPAKTDNSTAAAPATDSKQAPQSTYKLMPFSISVEGTYTQIMTFVYHMTKFPKVVVVQGLSINPKGDSSNVSSVGKSPLLGAEINLQAYLFNQTLADANGAAADAPGFAPFTAASNAIATTTRRVNAVSNGSVKLSNLHGRDQGLLDPSLMKFQPAKGGPSGEQNSVR